jgi:SapC
MLYEAVMPCSNARHGNWWVELGSDYRLTQQLSLVPLLITEFASAVLEYTIVFSGRDDQVMPAVLLSLAPGGNSYVGPNGEWRARYVPAFLRRYPFLLASTDGGKTVSLCIDESCSGFNQSGRGIPLFDGNGQMSSHLAEVVNFLKDYERDFEQTRAFCARLQQSGLLTPMQADIKLKSGKLTSLTGFSAVDRDRLHALPAQTVHELFRAGDLELIYTHSLSLRDL